MRKYRNSSVAALFSTLLAISGWCGFASASEYGVGTYRPGFMDSMSGALPPAGTTVVKSYFLYQDANTDASNGGISLRANTVSYTEVVLAVHVTHLKFFGANYAFGIAPETHLFQQSLGVGLTGGPLPHKNLTFGGMGDTVLLPIMLNWNFGKFHLLSLLAGYAPTGQYDSKRIVNTGLNRWAIEPDFGITWMDPDSGREASVFTGYTVNSRNADTDYRSGDEFHADFAAAQHLPHDIVAGIAGYAVQQTTPDTGTGAVFGGFRGRVLALGPLAAKTVEIGEQKIHFTFKYNVEFAAQHRGTGNECWLNAAIAL